MTREEPSVDELVRLGYEALSRGDWEALGELLTPDMELQRAPGLGSVTGSESVLGFARPEAFEWQRFEPQPVAARSEDRLLVPLVVRARGKDSAIEVVQEFFHVVTLREGRIARLAVFTSLEDAVADFEGPGP